MEVMLVRGPQGKGRVERLCKTWHDGLFKELLVERH